MRIPYYKSIDLFISDYKTHRYNYFYAPIQDSIGTVLGNTIDYSFKMNRVVENIRYIDSSPDFINEYITNDSLNSKNTYSSFDKIKSIIREYIPIKEMNDSFLFTFDCSKLNTYNEKYDYSFIVYTIIQRLMKNQKYFYWYKEDKKIEEKEVYRKFCIIFKNEDAFVNKEFFNNKLSVYLIMEVAKIIRDNANSQHPSEGKKIAELIEKKRFFDVIKDYSKYFDYKFIYNIDIESIYK